jgi:hypothetical protein
MAEPIDINIRIWWYGLTPEERNELCKKYLGFTTFFAANKEQLLKNYQIQEIYKNHFNLGFNPTSTPKN